ncbi:hypothetical protein COCNU_08G011120 [Cocos nucifera]|uniref:Uncharacterized protein n=1 Tax=Cocos nucifera TaxID=13894 RepID=A0A8K0N6M9_COCNU|nr:hypothetical protein COCNU_08G011120 [Cocos nucifera]
MQELTWRVVHHAICAVRLHLVRAIISSAQQQIKRTSSLFLPDPGCIVYNSQSIPNIGVNFHNYLCWAACIEMSVAAVGTSSPFNFYCEPNSLINATG